MIGALNRFGDPALVRGTDHRRSDCFRVERTQFPGGTFTRSRPAPFHGARVWGFFVSYPDKGSLCIGWHTRDMASAKALS
jgi:hypothetical protein